MQITLGLDMILKCLVHAGLVRLKQCLFGQYQILQRKGKQGRGQRQAVLKQAVYAQRDKQKAGGLEKEKSGWRANVFVWNHPPGCSWMGRVKITVSKRGRAHLHVIRKKQS